MLSALILTKNEEKNIGDAISSVNFAGEVIVIDDFSDDRTAEMAKKTGAEVFKRHLSGDFSQQRNFGLQKAIGPWVLFIDADEKVTPLLRREIIKSTNLQISKSAGYWIMRKNLFLGKQAGEDKVLRLAKKDTGKWGRIVHEEWMVKGEVGTLRGYLMHETADNLKEAIAKTNFYSTLHAMQNAKDGKKSNLFNIIFFPIAKLLENLLTGKGFVFGMLHSFHSFLAWSKLWLR